MFSKTKQYLLNYKKYDCETFDMKNVVRAVKTSVLFSLVAVLTACGGGGGATMPGTPVTSSLNFSLLSAWQEEVKRSTSRNFTISGGECWGSGNDVVTPIQPATGATESQSDQGIPISYSKTSTLSTFYTNCTGSGSQDRVMYYDGNYHLIQTEFASENILSDAPSPESVPESGLTIESVNVLGTTQQFFVYRYNSSIPAVIKAGDAITIATVDVLRRNCFESFTGPSCSISEEGAGELSVRARSESTESVLIDFVINMMIEGVESRDTSTYRLTSTGLTLIQQVLEKGDSEEIKTY